MGDGIERADIGLGAIAWTTDAFRESGVLTGRVQLWADMTEEQAAKVKRAADAYDALKAERDRLTKEAEGLRASLDRAAAIAYAYCDCVATVPEDCRAWKDIKTLTPPSERREERTDARD